MRRIWVLLILVVIVGAGCASSQQPESIIISEFSPGPLIEKSLPEEATFVGIGEVKETITLGRRMFHHREFRTTCLITPAGENEFMQALKTEVEKAIQSNGTEIQSRLLSERHSDSVLSGFKVGYTAGGVSGFISFWGMRDEGKRYSLIILIHEG